MIAYPEMLVNAAQEAKIKVPENVNNYNGNEYPHFRVFANCQLGISQSYMGCHFDNAKIIAAIPDDKIKTITWAEIIKLGFHYAQ